MYLNKYLHEQAISVHKSLYIYTDPKKIDSLSSLHFVLFGYVKYMKIELFPNELQLGGLLFVTAATKNFADANRLSPR
jgi:hypothetical protein